MTLLKDTAFIDQNTKLGHNFTEFVWWCNNRSFQQQWQLRNNQTSVRVAYLPKRHHLTFKNELMARPLNSKKHDADHLKDGLSPQYNEKRYYVMKIEFRHILVWGKFHTLVRNRSWKVLPFSFSFASFKELEQRNKYQIGKVYKDNSDTLYILARKNDNTSLYEQLKCNMQLFLLCYPA